MGDHELLDEEIVTGLDRAWDEVYLRNDRSGFASILADDFVATFSDGRTATKADMMRPTSDGARVTFSGAGMRLYPPTAVTYGRVRIEHVDRVVDQHYVRMFSKREARWQAVAVFVFPAAM